MAELIKTTNTIQGMKNEYYSRFGISYTPELNKTLNAKYGIAADQNPSVIPGTSRYNPPTIKYFGMGVKGYYNVDEYISETFHPYAHEDDLYQPIPFRIRPLSEDLSSVERAQYRMRVIHTINSVPYVAYYLKALTIPSNAVEVKYINADNQELDYNAVPNLTPEPVKLSDLGGAGNDSQYKAIVQVVATCQILAEEIAEAVAVLYAGDPARCKPSELGIYTGEDRSITGVGAGGGTVTYTEAIYAQLSMKRCSQGNSDFTTVAPKITFANGNLFLLM